MQAGIAAIVEAPPTCLLLDLHLPDGRGFDVLPVLREHAPLAPVGLLTGDKHPDVARESAQHAVVYLPKPLEGDDLLALLRRWLVEGAPLDATLSAWTTQYDLTPTEREVLALMASGIGPVAASRSLNIAPATLAKHITNLLEKTGDERIADASLRLWREAYPQQPTRGRP